MPRIAVCLSGCGVFDGSEIHEAVLTLLALDQAGAQAVCCAPDIKQAVIVDHVTRTPVQGQERKLLAESARISRGEITDLAKIRAPDIDALIFPGGYGVALNLSSFAKDGPDCQVNPEVERLVGEMLAVHKPIGAICIAPAMLALITGQRASGVKLTIGNDPQTAAAIERMGAQHIECGCEGVVVDEKNRIVSTPAYMLGKGPAGVFEGIRRLVTEVLRLAQRS